MLHDNTTHCGMSCSIIIKQSCCSTNWCRHACMTMSDESAAHCCNDPGMIAMACHCRAFVALTMPHPDKVYWLGLAWKGSTSWTCNSTAGKQPSTIDTSLRKRDRKLCCYVPIICIYRNWKSNLNPNTKRTGTCLSMRTCKDSTGAPNLCPCDMFSSQSESASPGNSRYRDTILSSSPSGCESLPGNVLQSRDLEIRLAIYFAVRGRTKFWNQNVSWPVYHLKDSVSKVSSTNVGFHTLYDADGTSVDISGFSEAGDISRVWERRQIAWERRQFSFFNVHKWKWKSAEIFCTYKHIGDDKIPLWKKN